MFLFKTTQETRPRNSPVSRADQVLCKLKEVRQFAKASIAVAQAVQESGANRHQDQAPVYSIGDSVWLNLENIATDRPAKKLD